MVKPRLQKSPVEKNCFGTKEWSKNSGICNGCDRKEACGKMQMKNNNL